VADRPDRPSPRRRASDVARLDQPQEFRRRFVPTPSFSQETFGALSEGFARWMGTAQFLFGMTVFVTIWLAWNTFANPSLQFDPRETNFTLLTLILSLQASYAAPLILLAQNRQADRDRSEVERDREMNSRSLADTEYLAREIVAIRLSLEQKADRDDLLEPIERLTSTLEQMQVGEHDESGPESLSRQ
jgi:uncharacterized membrane protein